MRINKHDTNGIKPLLSKGELGYDDYAAGGDTGRVYVGTGVENIALAERLESNMMTKAQFNALADERKANRAGSGFDEFGSNHSIKSGNVNKGIFTPSGADAVPNQIWLSVEDASSNKTSDGYPFTCINGVRQKLKSIGANYNKIQVPQAPTIYPHDTVLTPEQIASGVIKHADASNSGLIVNGKFDTDTSGWSGYFGGVLSIVDGRMRVSDTDGGTGARAVRAISTIVGKKYIVESYLYVGTALSVNLFATNNSNGSGSFAGIVTSTDKYTVLEFTATSTTTYIGVNKTTDSVAYFDIDNIAVYPADAISRSDLVFLESFHEDINEKNFVYPLGNTQYLGGNTDGLTGIANGVFTGFETYSLFGNWQTLSSLIGKGYVWGSLTESQKKAFIGNPENNCYLDGDKTIQVRYRVRVVQGLGDSWANVNPQNTVYMCYAEVSSNFVAAKGKSVSLPSDFRVANTNVYIPSSTYSNSLIKENGIFEMRTAENVSSFAYDNKCYAIPLALVSRRNQGMYHNVYNQNGTKVASDGLDCFRTTISFTSISDCFDPAKLLTNSGSIASAVSGRPD